MTPETLNILIILFIAILGYIFFNKRLIRYLYPLDDVNSPRAELLKIIIQSIGALIIIIGVFNSYTQIAKITEQNEVIRKGLTEERFKNAIDHLGSEKSTVVLGGIYSLPHPAVARFYRVIYLNPKH